VLPGCDSSVATRPKRQDGSVCIQRGPNTSQQKETVMSFTASADGGSTATLTADAPSEFGKFILEGIPYTYDEPLEPVLVMGGEGIAPNQFNVLKDGPAKDFGGNPGEHGGLPQGTAADVAPDGPRTEAQIRANPFQSIWWYFDGEPHRVTKALRFAYTVIQGGIPVTKHILIGYEGVDGQG
jgi:hypothetical protein